MRHTVEKHAVRCHCRSVGECQCNNFAWQKALDALVDDFADAMKAKLRKKFLEGKEGWDDPEWPLHVIQADLIEHAGVEMHTTGVTLKGHEVLDPVDIANFAAFWWNRTETT